MSVTHPESRLEFTFSDDWRVIKWDDHPAFKNGLCKAGDTKSVDFVGVFIDAPWLIEVKNFRQYRIENKERLSSGRQSPRLHRLDDVGVQAHTARRTGTGTFRPQYFWLERTNLCRVMARGGPRHDAGPSLRNGRDDQTRAEMAEPEGADHVQ
jgi:hypothetical protein